MRTCRRAISTATAARTDRRGVSPGRMKAFKWPPRRSLLLAPSVLVHKEALIRHISFYILIIVSQIAIEDKSAHCGSSLKARRSSHAKPGTEAEGSCQPGGDAAKCADRALPV